MRILPFLAASFLTAASPVAAQDFGWGGSARLRLQDPPRAEEEEEAGTALVDITRLELNPRLGALFFSEDFEADPAFAGGAMLRAPAPALSERLGAWIDLTVSSIDRDIDRLGDPDGVLVFVGAGADFSIVDDDRLLLRGQLGAQYGYFGGVDDLDNGVALTVGLLGGLRVTERVSFTLNPQIAFADAGDRIFFLHAGVNVGF